MEFCPRCASSVTDGAMTCAACGAPLWQPPASVQDVAVTPAPVALVLPAPLAVTPPPLPPQRVAEPPGPPPTPTPPSPAPPPALPPPPTTPTLVIPAAGPSMRRSNLVGGAGAVVAILVVVVLIVALPAHGARHNRQPVVATSAAAQFDLRALADAEETNLTATRVYTPDTTALAAAGYQPMPAEPVTILAGINRKSGYCLLGTAGGASPWFVYDSEQGGLLNRSFASEALARQACADTAITSFVPIG
ncbi:MAG TPA: zinc ribbon domain-containing protein [Mycobacteriales bacterium]|nr:zinc ribbon domain-containing protein [Mycobacteriales bacterium]